MLRPLLSMPYTHSLARVPAVALATTWREDLPNALTASRIVAVPLLAATKVVAEQTPAWAPLGRFIRA